MKESDTENNSDLYDKDLLMKVLSMKPEYLYEDFEQEEEKCNYCENKDR